MTTFQQQLHYNIYNDEFGERQKRTEEGKTIVRVTRYHRAYYYGQRSSWSVRYTTNVQLTGQ